MKKFLIVTFALLSISIMIIAVPARKQWTTVTLIDGSELKVMLVGDEWGHYYATEDGNIVKRLADGRFTYVDKTTTLDSIINSREKRIASNQLVTAQKAAKRAALGLAKSVQQETDRADNYMDYRGAKKGIVILAQFPNQNFYGSSSEAVAYHESMLNQEGYNLNDAPGSVHDYFTNASNGLFSLTFDVFGPVTMSKNSTYYGGTSTSIQDEGIVHAGLFATEAIKLANSTYDIDWQDYDWNGDKEVDQVFILYAGYGAATGGPTGCIWPHESTLSSMYISNYGGNGPVTFNGITVDTYACSNELDGSTGSSKMGMGTICHEFSHCMGLPDTYDISGGSDFCMKWWDIMDYGNYKDKNDLSGNGWCPTAWTAWEKHYAGWLDYTELQENDSIRNMQPLIHSNQAYTIYNDNNRNEYYILQAQGSDSWDSGLPSQGLLAIHVDYDQSLFSQNIVNATGSDYGNNHKRMTLLRRNTGSYTDTYPQTYSISAQTLSVDSITDTSYPRASLWNANTDNSYLMHKPVYNISYDNATSTCSFDYMPQATAAAIELVQTQENSNSMYHIYNMNGQEVTTATSINTATLPHGIYIFRKDGKSTKVQK